MHASQHRHRSIFRLCGHFTPLLAKHAFFVSFKLRNCNLPSRICNSNCIDMRLIVAIQSNLHTVMVFSAERILELVWGWENEAEINVVWVNISNLRKKLKNLGSRAVLRANRGLGYALEEET